MYMLVDLKLHTFLFCKSGEFVFRVESWFGSVIVKVSLYHRIIWFLYLTNWATLLVPSVKARVSVKFPVNAEENSCKDAPGTGGVLNRHCVAVIPDVQFFTWICLIAEQGSCELGDFNRYIPKLTYWIKTKWVMIEPANSLAACVVRYESCTAIRTLTPWASIRNCMEFYSQNIQ